MKTKLLFTLLILIFLVKLQSQSTFSWAKNTVYGAGTNMVSSNHRDASGNIWSTGIFQNLTDFDPGPGTFTKTTSSGYDGYVSKIDVNGNFLWAGVIGNGGSGSENVNDIITDASGNAYITGNYSTNNCDFDPGPGAYTVTPLLIDGFIVKLNASGIFQWMLPFKTSGYSTFKSISIDGSGNLYIAGSFNGMLDVDPGFGSTWFTSTTPNQDDIVIIKVDKFGNLVWAKQIGSTGYDYANSAVLDAAGNLHIVGTFTGTVDFDPNAGIQNLTSAGSDDFYVLKLDASGNYVWAKRMGGPQSEVVYSVDLDGAGNVYSTGTFSATADFDPSAATANLTSAGAIDVFISKLDALGNYVWAKQIGGTGGDYGYSIATDASSNVYATGSFAMTADFDPGPGTFSMISVGGQDVFVTKLNSAGIFINAIQIGGSNTEEAYCQTLDPAGNLYLSGIFSGTVDFDPGPGTFTLNTPNPVNQNVFLTKLAVGPLAVEEISSTDGFSMFPNPTNGFVTIINTKNEIGNIEVCNVIGERIFRSEIKKNKTEIDLSQQASGIYFIKVGSVTKKIIKE